MKRVEVSAICHGYAIDPGATQMYMFSNIQGGYWLPVPGITNVLSLWSAWTMNKKVWRGILTIKVEGVR